MTRGGIDPRKVALFAAIVFLSAVLAYLGQPLIHGNANAVNVVVTVFSVLAGFLVAIIAIVGDVTVMTPGSWRAVEMNRRLAVTRLNRHKHLFLLYLVTLALIFVSLLFDKAWASATVWLERFYLGFGTLAFCLSLRLPSTLMGAQLERIELEIEARRREANIAPLDTNSGPPSQSPK